MKEFTKNAKTHMENNGSTLVCCNKDEIHSVKTRGVLYLVTEVLNKNTMKGFCCADKVVGRAAAFMYVFLQPDEIYAGILSEKAKEVFELYNINYCYGELVPAIINRTGDGFCPMETATENAKTPKEALLILKEKLNLSEPSGNGKQVSVPIIRAEK